MAESTNNEFLQHLVPSVGVILRDRVAKSPNREAYRYLRGEDWVSVTWTEAAKDAYELAAGLLSLGLQKGDRVAIVAGTRYEWVLADLAVMCAGGATTTVYPTTSAEDAAYILADAGCKIAFVEDAVQFEKIESHADEIPDLGKMIVMEHVAGSTSFDEVRALGRELLAANPNAVTEATDAIGPDDLATLIYTSGTTGKPKGVRLTHRSWVYEGESLNQLDLLHEDDVNFLWLPMAHAFGKVILSAQLSIGYSTAIDGRVDKIIENLAVIRPTFMGAAPRIFEKAYGKILSAQAAEGGLKEKIFKSAFAVGTEYERRRAAGQPIGLGLKLRHRLFDRLVFSKVRERFGGRVRFFLSGSAPLNSEIAEWFNAAGIVIVEGYGLTESTAGAFVARPIDNKFGTVGRALPGSEARIGDEGEIQLRGPHIMSGYNNLPEASNEAFTEDGWFRTGDQGSIDADGYLTITGRLKDLIKTSGGKIVVPGAVEAAFKALCPYVSQFLVFGDKHPYCVALVTLDPDSIATWCADNGVTAKSYAEQVSSPQVEALVAGYVEQLNERLNKWETIKRWTILDADLSIESGELTPSMKVKRALVEREQAERIEAMYAS